MKNKYNIKHNHREKGRNAGQFQNKGFIPAIKEKINFSVGDNVFFKKSTWRGDSGFFIKGFFYNKYNELKYVLKNNSNEQECFSWEIYLLPLTRKVLVEKYNKESIKFDNGSFIVSGSTYTLYIDCFSQVQIEGYYSIFPTTRFRGRY